MEPMEIWDLVIIGAGPAGISAAVEAQRGGLQRIVLLEKGDSHSQMIRTYYKEGKRVDAQYAGQEAICQGWLCLRNGNRETYLGLMDHVIRQHRLDIRYRAEVWSVRKLADDNSFEILVNGMSPLRARAVVVAIGKMGKPNQPEFYREIPGTLKLARRILFDLTTRPIENERVLVVGGGDSAVEYVEALSRANRVTISYRRAEFVRVNPTNLRIVNELIGSEKARALMPSTLLGIDDDEGLPRARFAEAAFEAETFDAVVFALGGMNPVEFLRTAGVALGPKGDPQVDGHHATSVPGLYVVGDLLGKGHGGGSIIAGFNSAAEATRHLLWHVFGKELAPEYVSLDHLKF